MSKILVALNGNFASDIRVRRQVDLLIEGGHEIRVLSFSEAAGNTHNKNLIVKTVSISSFLRNIMLPTANRLPLFDAFWTKIIVRELKAFNPQYLIGHDLYMSKPCRRAIVKSNSNCKLVLDLHENFPEAIKLYGWTKGFWRNWLVLPKKWANKEGSYLRMADLLVFLSAAFRKSKISQFGLDASKSVAFPNVINIELFESYAIDRSLQLSEDRKVLLYFGAVAERRGIFDVLKYFQENQKHFDKIKLVVIGPVDKADRGKLNHYINILSSEIFQYINWINLEELPSYINASNWCLAPFWINPQHESGIANKLFQYMFGAKPILASNCEPQAQLITESNCGLIFKSEKELIDILTNINESKYDEQKMGENGREALYRDWSLEKQAKDFLGLFH